MKSQPTRLNEEPPIYVDEFAKGSKHYYQSDESHKEYFIKEPSEETTVHWIDFAKSRSFWTNEAE